MTHATTIEKFVSHGILNTVNINNTVFHHITVPSKTVFSKQCIAMLNERYNPKEEIGGFAICEAKIIGTEVILRFDKVHIVQNCSDEPWNSYRPYKTEVQRKNYEDILQSYIQQGLLPFRFHSHPVAANDLLQEKLRYVGQLDTSERDQVTSLYHKNIEKAKLRLPDILIVQEGQSMFIGLYGGLICPNKFDEQKRKVISNMSDNIVNNFSDWIDTPNKQIGLAVGVVALIFLAIRYPKIVIPITVTSASIMPTMIYEHQKNPEYFSITNGNSIIIGLPKIGINEMMANEKKLLEIKIKLDNQ